MKNVRIRGPFAAVTVASFAVVAFVHCKVDEGVAQPDDAGATATDSQSSDVYVGPGTDAADAAAADPGCFLPTTKHAPGSLDTTFGKASGAGGYALVSGMFDPNRAGQVEQVAVDGKGRIVAALTTWDFGKSRMVIAGWDPNGNADPRFGANGARDLGVPDAGSGNPEAGPEDRSEAAALGLAADDSIVVAGSLIANNVPFSVPLFVRLSSDGGPDPSFGPGGARALPMPSGWSFGWVRKARVGADGTIVAATQSNSADGGQSRQGVLVFTVSPTGHVTAIVEDETGGDHIPEGLALTDAGGTLLVRRSAQVPSFFFARFVPGSSATPTLFFESGPTTLPGFLATSFDILPDGRFVVAGETDDRLTLARVNANGTLDNTFGDAGLSTIADAAPEDPDAGFPRVKFFPFNILRHSQGSFYLAGRVETRLSSDPFDGTDLAVGVVHVNEDGTLDTAFGKGGLATFKSEVDGRSLTFGAVPVLAEDRCRGRILVGGRSNDTPGIFAFWP